jgi:DedD protein
MRMIEQGAVRNLEQIQEEEAGGSMPKAASVTIVALGGACIVFASLAIGGRRAPLPPPSDPLGELVAQKGHKGGPAAAIAKPTDLRAEDVTFPGMLSDDKSPTTALAAVKNQPPPSAIPQVSTLIAPPPPEDRLPVVAVAPLPAQNILEATPVVTRPRDTMTKTASDAAQVVTAAPPTTGAGHDGGYQLQVSSFRTQAEANQFSDQLRARGHKSYVMEAHVPGRGTWYRVRVGPFTTQHAAMAYRASFEAKEHVVPFVVPPLAHDAPAH